MWSIKISPPKSQTPRDSQSHSAVRRRTIRQLSPSGVELHNGQSGASTKSSSFVFNVRCSVNGVHGNSVGERRSVGDGGDRRRSIASGSFSRLIVYHCQSDRIATPRWPGIPHRHVDTLKPIRAPVNRAAPMHCDVTSIFKFFKKFFVRFSFHDKNVINQQSVLTI